MSETIRELAAIWLADRDAKVWNEMSEPLHDDYRREADELLAALGADPARVLGERVRKLCAKPNLCAIEIDPPHKGRAVWGVGVTFWGPVPEEWHEGATLDAAVLAALGKEE